MEPQNSIYYSSRRDDSKPRIIPKNSYTNWQNRTAPGQEMERHHSNNSNGSNDSAYYSVVSQLSEDVHFPERSLAMSYSAGSPVPLCEGDNLSNTQYYNRQYLESNPPLQDSDSDRGNLYRPTPTSLKWLDTDLLSLYKFVVPKGKEPYFELLPSYFVSSETPEIVYLDHPRNPQKNAFPCQYPSCDEKVFKRPADLERHLRNVHANLDQKEQYLCDYPPCKKVRGAFTRKDHFRDHLRDYHKEDLGSMRKERNFDSKQWLKRQDAWIAERKIVADWWRCPKCLQRVQIAGSGYECQPCKYPCDRERADRINIVRTKAPSVALTVSDSGMEDIQYDTAAGAIATYTTNYSTSNATINCSSCNDSAYIWNESNGGSWDLCAACQSSLEQTYKYEDVWSHGGGSYASNSRY